MRNYTAYTQHRSAIKSTGHTLEFLSSIYSFCVSVQIKVAACSHGHPLQVIRVVCPNRELMVSKKGGVVTFNNVYQDVSPIPTSLLADNLATTPLKQVCLQLVKKMN